jgi:predicted DCC family thiol-disulfide oxidoreductase YuxK
MELSDLPKDKKIILFDGVCNLCNSAVQYVIERDQKDLFRFAPLQSELGKKIINHIGIASQNIDSIILYEPGKAYYYKSSAAIEIARNLKGIITYSGIFKVIPSRLRDMIYDYVATNRYKWYGQKESCMIPTAELKSKFLG